MTDTMLVMLAMVTVTFSSIVTILSSVLMISRSRRRDALAMKRLAWGDAEAERIAAYWQERRR